MRVAPRRDDPPPPGRDAWVRRLAVAIAVVGLAAGGCQQPDEPVPTPGVGPTPNTGVGLSPTTDIEAIIAVRVAATVEAVPTPTLDPTATPVPTETPATPSPTPALMPSPISSMREMEVEDIRWPEESVPVVLLKEKEGNRYLPIWLGPLEAGAIAVKLQDIQAERPMTQDLLHSVVSRLGGRTVHVIITDLADNTFYAKDRAHARRKRSRVGLTAERCPGTGLESGCAHFR